MPARKIVKHRHSSGGDTLLTMHPDVVPSQSQARTSAAVSQLHTYLLIHPPAIQQHDQRGEALAAVHDSSYAQRLMLRCFADARQLAE